MARNRQRVYGRGKFTAFLKGLEWAARVRTWASSDELQKAYVRFHDSSCPNHPKIILRGAGFGILCENGDYEKCCSQQRVYFDSAESDRPSAEPPYVYCDHFLYSVGEYVKECSGSRHVIGTRIKENFGSYSVEEL